MAVDYVFWTLFGVEDVFFWGHIDLISFSDCTPECKCLLAWVGKAGVWIGRHRAETENGKLQRTNDIHHLGLLEGEGQQQGEA